MQPKIIIKGEKAIHGIRGDGGEPNTLWEKFEKRFVRKPFEKVGECAYEIRTSNGKKPVRPGRDVLVGYERALKNNEGGYNCIVLPAGEYAVFDICTDDGYDSDNTAIRKWLDENGTYIRREIYDNNFILICYDPEKSKDGDKPDSVEIRIPVFNKRKSIIPDLLQEQSFGYISAENKEFITVFDAEMEKCGYSAGNTIGNGFCWSRHMLIYSKVNVKSPVVAARIYLRESGICLRLFLNDVTKHGGYIGNAPDFIKSVFTGEYGKCRHCKGDNCKFRMDYEIGGVKYEKCNGYTFEFYSPDTKKLPEYITLFKEFYCKKGNSI